MKLIRTQKGMRFRRINEFQGYWSEKEIDDWRNDYWNYMNGNF